MPILLLLFKTQKLPPTYQDEPAPTLLSLTFSLHPLIFLKFLFHKLPAFYNFFVRLYISIFSPLLDWPVWPYMPQCPPLLQRPPCLGASCTITKSLISRVAGALYPQLWPGESERERERERERKHINETKKKRRAVQNEIWRRRLDQELSPLWLCVCFYLKMYACVHACVQRKHCMCVSMCNHADMYVHVCVSGVSDR